MATPERAERVLWLGFGGNMVLAVLKVGFGGLGFGSLFVLDGLFSAAIAANLGALLIGTQLSSGRYRTRRYSYGMGKAQFLLAMLLGGLLVVGASVALGLTIKRFGHADPVLPSVLTVLFAVIALGGNLLLWLVLRSAASSTAEPGLRRAAGHQALGIAASVSVLQSMVLLGYHWTVAERIGRLGISLLMLWLAVQIIRAALNGVMDESSGSQIDQAIRDLATGVERVEEVRWVRSRRAGAVIHVDLEVALDRSCTVADSDRVAAQIKRLVASRLEQPTDVVNVTFGTV